MKGSKNMSWVNLNDVYVNQTGGTIAGDLSVNGALTVNDGKGTNTTYNVANEITTLRDSVSQCHTINSVVFLANGKTPTEVGLSGKWTKTDWSICTQSRLVFDIVNGNTGINGTNVQIHAYNGSVAQKFWFYTADFGDVNMWVRTAQYSVSQDTGWIKLYTGYNGLIKYRATLNTCCLMVCGLYGFTTGYAVPNELPNEYLPTCEPLYCPLYMRQSNNTAGIWIPQRDSSDRKFYLYSGIQTNAATSIGGFVYWTIQ